MGTSAKYNEVMLKTSYLHKNLTIEFNNCPFSLQKGNLCVTSKVACIDFSKMDENKPQFWNKFVTTGLLAYSDTG